VDTKDLETLKVLAVAKYAKVEVQVVEGTEADAKKSPDCTLPFLETKEGIVFGSNASARYIAKHSKVLGGASDIEVAQIEAWVDFAHDLSLPASVWTFPILGLVPNNKDAVQKAKGDVRKALEILNHYLQTRTFLVGQRISLADVVLGLSFYHLYAKVLDTNFRKAFVNVNRWFLTVVNQPEVASVVGSFKMCEKMEIAPETPTGAEGKKEKKEDKPKKEEKPKEVKKEEKKKEEKKPKDDEEEEPSFEEPKKKNPLDSLPPSKMIMDDWKRMYSNNDTRTVAMPWFWEHYDADGYSIFFGHYKYNDELKQLFMTRNFVGGYLQRMDACRKYAFGTFCLFGSETSQEISCCLMFRGKGLPEVFKDVDDTEHFNWTEVDLSDAKQKALVTDFWAWDGEFGGRKFLEAKTFK